MRHSPLRSALFAAAFAIATPAAAQDGGATGSGAGSGAAGPPPNAPVVDIDGFRSVSFGMDEAEVRAAIVSDFEIEETAIDRVLNPLERTVSLMVTVDDLIPDATPARIAYLFGNGNGTLTQVSIIWGATVAGEAPLDQLLASDRLLRGYFSQRRFAEGSILSELPLSDGSYLSFTGSDADGHRATLAVSSLGEDFLAIDPSAPPTDREVIVRLSYVADPGNADVFRLPPP